MKECAFCMCEIDIEDEHICRMAELICDECAKVEEVSLDEQS